MTATEKPKAESGGKILNFKVMGRGSKETTNSDGTTHHTDYNDAGRHSYNYDDSGNVTKDHATYNDNQDNHINGPDHNMNDVSWTPEDQYNEFNGIK